MPKANRPISDYEEYTTYRGETVKVYAVPQQLLRGVTPTREKPKRPSVTMKTKVGEQQRWAKKGDPEWDDYQELLEQWEQEQDELQEAISYCLALRDYDIPSDPKVEDFPNHLKVLIETGLLPLSKDIWLRKFAWLRAVVLGQHDEYNISLIIQRLSGIPEDIINEMKKNFRNILLGQTPRGLGESALNGSEPISELSDEQSLLEGV